MPPPPPLPPPLLLPPLLLLLLLLLLLFLLQSQLLQPWLVEAQRACVIGPADEDWIATACV